MYQMQQLQQPVYSFGGSLQQQPLLYSQTAPGLPPPQYVPIATSQVYPQPSAINSRIASIQLQPHNSLQYSQQQPYHSIHQQPVFLPPTSYTQPLSVIRRHPQTDTSLNFDYESANFLVESKITQPTIYCVLCQCEYKETERKQHVKKHTHPVSSRLPLRDVETKMPEKGKTVISKPIVEPEEFNIRYEPTVYRLNKEIVFEDEKGVEKKDISLGFDGRQEEDVRVHKGNGNSMNVPVHVLDEEPHVVVMEPEIRPVQAREEQIVVMQPQNLASFVNISPTGNVEATHPFIDPIIEEQPFSFKQSAGPTILNPNEQPSRYTHQFSRETFEIQPTSHPPQDLDLKRGESKQKQEFSGQIVQIRPSVSRPLRTSEDSFNEIMKGVMGDVQIEGEEKRRMPSRVQW